MRNWIVLATCAAALSLGALRAIAQPASEPATQPAMQEPAPTVPTAPPATEPVTESATQPAATESTTQPVTEPATTPAANEAATEPAPPAAPATAPASMPVAPDELEARRAMAEHYVEMGKIVMNQPTLTPALLDQNAVLLSAAVRENPDDPRIARLAMEAASLRSDTEELRARARDAIAHYLKLVPGDQIAQTRLIDLVTRDRQDADAKVAYLSKVIEADTVAAEVRSHAAMLLSHVEAERGDAEHAGEAIEKAINLNPLNLEAQRGHYARQAAGASPAQRITMLLAQLRADPAQPEVDAQIAHELLDSGLVNQAKTWYDSSFDLSNRMGRGLNMADFLERTASLIVSGEPRQASSDAERILSADPGNVDAAFVRLLAQRRLASAAAPVPDALAAVETSVGDALSRRLQDLHAQLSGSVSAPTTQPLQQSTDDMAADAAKLKTDPGNALWQPVVGALARLAWFDLYFRRDAGAAAKPLDDLHQLLSDTDVTMTRLDGWKLLMEGNNEGSRTKLSAVAERDPLSKLGLIVLDEKEKGGIHGPATAPDELDPAHPGRTEHGGEADALAALAGENAAGVTGAILAEELRARGIRFVPAEIAPQLLAELNKFPKEFLDILSQPSDFYKIVAFPLSVSHKVGEPMYAQITVSNVSNYDLAVGADGTIKPDLWFDARIGGLLQQGMDGAAYDRISQAIVLKARSGEVTQIVRMDDGRLAQVLIQLPVMALPMQFSVFTNPVPAQTGIVPGPAGIRAQFSRVMERAGTPISQADADAALVKTMSDGAAVDRMRTADLIAVLHRMIETTPNAQKEMVEVANVLKSALERAAVVHDDAPTAHAWIVIMNAFSADDAARNQALIELLSSEDWSHRMLGLRLLQTQPGARQKSIAAKFAAADPDETVRQYATSIVQTADLTGAPTTAPSGPTPIEPTSAAPSPGAEPGFQPLAPATTGPAEPPMGR